MKKQWRLEKTKWPNGKIEWSVRDLKYGFLAETSLNEWMMPDVIETCGGTQNIEFEDPDDFKNFSLLYQIGMIELEESQEKNKFSGVV